MIGRKNHRRCGRGVWYSSWWGKYNRKLGDNSLKDRSAISTLKGYFYQFDFTILQLLKLNYMTDKIMVEGIEDVDVSSADSKMAIQAHFQKLIF